MSPTVSVLLPAKNAEETVAQALLSLKRQSLTDFEIVMVDDGSEDRTVEVASRVFENDPRLRTIETEALGLVPALSRGLAACSATVIARMDADDVSLPGRLEAQVAYLRAHPQCHVVGCGVESFAEHELGEGYRQYDQWLNGLTLHEDMVKESFVESPLCHPSVVFRRDSVVELGGYRDMGWPEDYDLWLRCIEAGLRLGKVPQVLFRWRDYPARTSRRDPRYDAHAFLRCKAHFLGRGFLSGSSVLLWGGRLASQLGKHLQREGVHVEAYVDVDERKIGGRRRGRPVVAPQDLGDYRHCRLVAAVGSRGARDLIRAEATRQGFVEGEKLLVRRLGFASREIAREELLEGHGKLGAW